MLELSHKHGVEVQRREVETDYGQIKTGFYVDFDLLADDDRELFEELKAQGFNSHSKRLYLDLEAGTNDTPDAIALKQARKALDGGDYVTAEAEYDQSTIMTLAHQLAGEIGHSGYADALSEALKRAWSEAREQMEDAQNRSQIDCKYVARVHGEHKKYDLDREFLDENKHGYLLRDDRVYEIDYNGERDYYINGEEATYEEVKEHVDEAKTIKCWECGTEYSFSQVSASDRLAAAEPRGRRFHCGC